MRYKGIKNTKKYSLWTHKEELEFKKLYPYKTILELMTYFDKSRYSVYTKAKEFNIRKLGPLKEYDIRFVKDHAKPMSGVYVIKCLVNNKMYIGYSNDIRKRLLCHIKCLSKEICPKQYNKPLFNDWKKYENRFTFAVPYYVSCEDALNIEMELLNGINPALLYNITICRKIESLLPNQKTRFWKNVARKNKDDCWHWQGWLNRQEYGEYNVNGNKYLAHRIAFKLHNDKDPLGLLVLHKCDNPSCCNPHHLFLGTDYDNILDMINKGRNNRNRGHKSRFNQQDINKMIELRKECKGYKEIAKVFNVTDSTISNILNKEQKTTNKFVGDFDTKLYRQKDIKYNRPKKIKKIKKNKSVQLYEWLENIKLPKSVLSLYSDYCKDHNEPLKLNSFKCLISQKYDVRFNSVPGDFLILNRINKEKDCFLNKG